MARVDVAESRQLNTKPSSADDSSHGSGAAAQQSADPKAELRRRLRLLVAEKAAAGFTLWEIQCDEEVNAVWEALSEIADEAPPENLLLRYAGRDLPRWRTTR